MSVAPKMYHQTHCNFPACTGVHNSNGLCSSHVQQMRKGQPLRPTRNDFDAYMALMIGQAYQRGYDCALREMAEVER